MTSTACDDQFINRPKGATVITNFEHFSYRRLENKKLNLEISIERQQETLSEVEVELQRRQSTTMSKEEAKTELGRPADYIRG